MVCPHCRGVAGVEPNAEFIFVCKLCGGPRIPTPRGSNAGDSSLPLLRNVDTLRKKRAGMKALGYVGIVGLIGAAVIGLPVSLFSVTAAAVILALFGGPSAAMTFYGRSQVSKLTQQLSGSMDAAWSNTVSELMRSGTVKNATDLQRVTNVDPQRAAHLFNLATVEFDIGSAHTGMRIEGAPVPLPEDPRFAALEARAAVEQQAEAEAAEAETNAAARGRVQ
jgi:hypothetical protein